MIGEIGGMIDGLLNGFYEYRMMSKEMKLRRISIEKEAELSGKQIDATLKCMLATIDARLEEIRFRMDLIGEEMKSRHIERVKMFEVIGVMSGHLALPDIDSGHAEVIKQTISDFSTILKESTVDSYLKIDRVLDSTPSILSQSETHLLSPGGGA